MINITIIYKTYLLSKLVDLFYLQLRKIIQLFLKLLTMTTNTRNRSEHLIYQKRIQQDRLSNLQTKLRQQFHQKQFAKWQNKGNDVNKINQIKQKLQEMRNNSNYNLNQRRKQLAELLEKEHALYQSQIIGNQQTPEQIRSRMVQRLKVLKQERQNSRKGYVNQQLYKRFELNADELRKVDLELKQLKVDYQRNLQLIQKQNILNNQYEQQVLFAELNRRQLKKKQQKEKEKLRQQKQKNQQRNAILAIQKQMKEQKVKKQKQMGQAQKKMLRDQWERQKQIRNLKDQQIILKSKQIAKQVIIANQQQRRQKQEQLKRQKINDKELIERIVEKQNQIIQFQREAKQKWREQAKKIIAGLKSKTQQLINYQKQLDKLIDAERLKKEQKQNEQWQKRQEARIKLLYDVYNDRESKLKEHQKQKEQEKKIKESDKVYVEEKVKKQNEIQESLRQKEYERNKRQQNRLLQDIRLKEQKRRNILQELQKQDEEINRARIQYQQKILEKKQKGRQQLDQFKKTNRIF